MQNKHTLSYTHSKISVEKSLSLISELLTEETKESDNDIFKKQRLTGSGQVEFEFWESLYVRFGHTAQCSGSLSFTLSWF